MASAGQRRCRTLSGPDETSGPGDLLRRRRVPRHAGDRPRLDPLSAHRPARAVAVRSERGTLDYISGVEAGQRQLAFKSWSPVRVIGTVPVEPDGSAHFTVPADVAIYFQALDDRQMEVRRMRSFVSLKPGEVRSCHGCHESQGRPPEAGPGSVWRWPAPPSAPRRRRGVPSGCWVTSGWCNRSSTGIAWSVTAPSARGRDRPECVRAGDGLLSRTTRCSAARATASLPGTGTGIDGRSLLRRLDHPAEAVRFPPEPLDPHAAGRSAASRARRLTPDEWTAWSPGSMPTHPTTMAS
jgi:hypothetical protein